LIVIIAYYITVHIDFLPGLGIFKQAGRFDKPRQSVGPFAMICGAARELAALAQGDPNTLLCSQSLLPHQDFATKLRQQGRTCISMTLGGGLAHQPGD